MKDFSSVLGMRLAHMNTISADGFIFSPIMNSPKRKKKKYEDEALEVETKLMKELTEHIDREILNQIQYYGNKGDDCN